MSDEYISGLGVNRFWAGDYVASLGINRFEGNVERASSAGTKMKPKMKHSKFKIAAALVVLGVLAAAGCSTVAPKPVTAAQGSFDTLPDARGNYQNSGLLGFTNHQAILTPSARARYNALGAKWGNKFIPPVKPDDGLTLVTNWGGAAGRVVWLMDQDHLDKFATMSVWQRQPAPVKPP